MPISFPYRVDPTGRTATPSSEAAHARELIEQVLFTSPGERVMRPTFGTGVHQLVFAPAGDQAAAAAQHLVTGALQQWLGGWIEVQDVTVVGEGATLTITVRYRLLVSGEADLVTFTMEP
jgi:phage baseplate assembly protein W